MGIRCFQGPIVKLRVPLSAVSSRQGRLFRVSVLLFNMRTDLVGLNQIGTTYESRGMGNEPWMKRFQKELDVVPLDSADMVYFTDRKTT